MDKIDPIYRGREYIPEAYQKVARDMEKSFIKFMIEQMNKTVPSSEAPGTAMNYYNGLLVEERAKTMARNRGGMQIQDMILDQIYPKERRHKLAYEAYLRAMQNQLPGNHKIKHHESKDSISKGPL